jgi:hypothetical protein
MTDVRTNGAHLPEKIPGDNAPANAGENFVFRKVVELLRDKCGWLKIVPPCDRRRFDYM